MALVEKNENSRGKFYTLFIDGKEFQVQQATITGAEIMELGDIPQSIGLILCKEDDTEEAIRPEDIIKFEGPGRRFKKAPRFKRGEA